MDMRRGDFLKGMRVLDFSRYLPGPYATMRLADMGADVIKVEDPHIGDPAAICLPWPRRPDASFSS